MATDTTQTIMPRNVEEEMKDSYLRYSMSVIISRALPDARDGLKPSQRRILYAMRQLNLGPNSKHRKCAKISGDTSGDYHPHGDMVIYPTLVRMAQDWVMRYKLIDGQGNFGSVDGDPPAAMRYTEARMTAATMDLMEDIDKETVDMVPNYDETKLEPTVFPSKFPHLLSNGSSGIAVGMATNIPPHNLGELIEATKLLIDNPLTTIDEIKEVMPAPDFPTGGIICGYRGAHEAFHTGRGKIILRGVVHVETHRAHKDRESIVIDEIPYNVNKTTLIEQIADLINEKALPGISDLRDESDKDGMRIVIELKKGEVPDVTLNQLYKYTAMQVTFGCNMLALDKGMPRLMNIKQLIQAWIEHRIEVIRRRTRFELNKAEARAHILEGYLKALDHLDAVVAVIRASENRQQAKEQLMEQFAFSDKQAHAVLDLRLYQLTGLERDKLDSEYKELLNRIDYLRSLLASEALIRGVIKEELDIVKTRHPSKRRTQIIAAEGEMVMEDLIANDQTIITISQDDYIKRMPVDTFREQRRGGAGIAGMAMKREDDVLKNLFVANMHDTLLLFTSLGRCYWLKVWQLPETGRKSKGKPLINLLEGLLPNEKIATLLKVKALDEPETCILLATKNGVIKKTELSAFTHPRKKGVFAIQLDEGDSAISVRLVRPTQQIMLFSHDGMAVRFDEGQLRPIGRTARGVRGMTLRDQDYVVSLEVVTPEETVLVVCENGYGKRSSVDEFRQTNRGGVGVRSIITSERNGKVVGALTVTDNDSLVMMSNGGQTVRIGIDELRVLGRATQGVRLLNLKEGDTLVAFEKVARIEGEEAEVAGEIAVEGKGEVQGEALNTTPAPETHEQN